MPSRPPRRPRPWFVSLGLFCLFVVVGLQYAGVLSRNQTGVSMLAIIGVMWLVMWATQDPTDD
ncbi:MAG: hypothetical protein J0H69_20245 [Burkholderiales bacterium]|nr:hypothetical protein [Burkholderiales bacterium]